MAAMDSVVLQGRTDLPMSMCLFFEFCCSSPPPKPAAFEMFKEEYGSKISRIFKENKSILLDRKKRRSTVTQRINSMKLEMESIKKALEDQQQERWQQGKWTLASNNLTEEGSHWFQSSSGSETSGPPLLPARARLYAPALQLSLCFAT